MKIIEPSAELVDEINPEQISEQILLKLEVCGRVSHKSKPKQNFTGTIGSTINFVSMLIKRGHESVLEHVSLTFKIVCDRAIMAELTRHRLASFTVESTRYVKYDELTVIQPPLKSDEAIVYFRCAMREHERNYQTLIANGEPSEIARAVLPLCTATTLYMTANLREWRHVLKLRTDKAAHPQMRQIMNQILAVFKEKLPVIVEDIDNA